MIEQLLDLFVKNGLRPLNWMPEARELEQSVNSSELSALVLLDYYEELTMSELAEHLGAPLSTITSLAKRLVRKELIDRKQSDRDQRIILVRLTSDGRQLAAQAKGILESSLVRVQDTLTAEELQQFIALALKVGRALQQGDKEEKAMPAKSLHKIQIED
ncbi:MarR family transcriptional regulator [Paenibacillus sp. SC116]|uniref:MarR family winged helix-turn-helix transcriptional regulator n=1 Tax=Paenibacillus sp. SC116 TaxID=2968986 RepID=UPI00215B5C0B|nr:MarR family transcriptional regulator [Paenibacillus sp. SC116]MCR8842129.1 MarR family transcriptional regulator [Paenibacillus sp. SC116]